MGKFVIAAYRPRAGKEARLLQLVKEHLPILRREGLVTDRPALVMRSHNGTIVEVFEWQSADAIMRAHTNPAVNAMWERFNEACEHETLSNLEECHRLFADFEPIAV
jgi:hypothetical protein